MSLFEVQPETVAHFATEGSPVLLNAVGRAFGLGRGEQQALANGAMPGWALALLGAGAGLAVGIYVQRKWPQVGRKVFK
jgi:hypothetical protein